MKSAHHWAICDTAFIFLALINFPGYQILDMSQEKDKIAGKVHYIIDKFAERGLRSLAVAYQVYRFGNLMFLLTDFFGLFEVLLGRREYNFRISGCLVIVVN